MLEILPNQDFYPFVNLIELKPLDRKSVATKNFIINAAVCRWQFAGIKIDFRLFASMDTIDDLSRSETPMGNIPVDLDFHNGFYTLRKAPIDIFVEFRSKNLDLLKNAQWYRARFVLGSHIYDVDVADDWDLAFDEPIQFPPRKEIVLGGGLQALREKKSGVALPYDLDRIKQIRCRMVEKALPT